MSLAPLDLTLPTDSLRILPWPDPVIDRLGHDPRSAYAERFWLPILGPSTYLLARRLVAGFDRSPDGFDLPLLDTAQSLGLGTKGGRNAPFLRSIGRAITFHVCQSTGDRTLAVRRRVPPLTRVQVGRLAAPLRDEHDEWLRASDRRPGHVEQRVRARRLALSLVELGETDEEIEHQLFRWQLHPALAHEALQWARLRTRTTPTTIDLTDTATEAPAAAIPPPPTIARFSPAGEPG